MKSFHCRSISFSILFWLALTCVPLITHAADVKIPFRPPAVPLVTFDPYLSIWSEADKLTDKNTQHWTHREHSLVSLIRIDGKAYRLMGADPANVPALRPGFACKCCRRAASTNLKMPEFTSR